MVKGNQWFFISPDHKAGGCSVAKGVGLTSPEMLVMVLDAGWWVSSNCFGTETKLPL